VHSNFFVIGIKGNIEAGRWPTYREVDPSTNNVIGQQGVGLLRLNPKLLHIASEGEGGLGSYGMLKSLTDYMERRWGRPSLKLQPFCEFRRNYFPYLSAEEIIGGIRKRFGIGRELT